MEDASFWLGVAFGVFGSTVTFAIIAWLATLWANLQLKDRGADYWGDQYHGPR